MAAHLDYCDLPIEKPDQDRFGIDPFVKSLARSIREMRSPEGVVIALNGPWGSGKSSAVNLLKHHLDDAKQSGDIEILSFNPWWFRGEEALVLAFFRDLYAATKPSLPDQAKKILPKLGARLLKGGSVVAPVADALGASGTGSIAAGAMNWLSGLIDDEESVEKLHDELAKALSNQKKRFVVFIDDIDRLAPDEALAMFRLVKSVGRLPNIIYVLAFDRALAEKMVKEKFPSEGANYLEKIVQASFDLPMPNKTDLCQHLQEGIFDISGAPDENVMVHFMNLFHEIVAPEIQTPRDSIRYLNAFSITWPAVAGEVDLGDFVALEAYRLFRPAIYEAIRINQGLVCGSASISVGRVSMPREELDACLLSSIPSKDRFRKGLMRLFPKLESIWANVFHDGGMALKQRRVCTSQHFPTYFRLSLPEDIVASKEIKVWIEKSDNVEWLTRRLETEILSKRRNGGTHAALILGS